MNEVLSFEVAAALVLIFLLIGFGPGLDDADLDKFSESPLGKAISAIKRKIIG